MSILSKLLKLKPKRKVVQICSYVTRQPGVSSGTPHGHIVALCNDGTLWLKHMEKPNGWFEIEGVPQI